MFHKQNGNALLYVLIAITLLAVLTYTIMGEQRGQQQNQLSESRIKLLASDLISHANAAEIAIKQMEMFGVEADQILFDLPGTAGYSTNVTRQLYHPSGGGLSPMQNIKNYTSNYSGSLLGWQTRNDINVDWTPSSETDFVFSFWQVREDVCTQINIQLHNIDNPISVDVSFSGFQSSFMTGHTPTSNFIETECPNCVGKKSACIIRDSDQFALFYNIIGAR